MTENHNPFAQFGLERAIALRWTLRDIKAKRLKLSPVSDADLRALIDLGLVEMRDDAPVLTNAGHAVLDWRVFDSSRKEKHWGRRKLARDSWRKSPVAEKNRH
jgi:hypothetical protein